MFVDTRGNGSPRRSRPRDLSSTCWRARPIYGFILIWFEPMLSRFFKRAIAAARSSASIYTVNCITNWRNSSRLSRRELVSRSLLDDSRGRESRPDSSWIASVDLKLAYHGAETILFSPTTDKLHASFSR